MSKSRIVKPVVSTRAEAEAALREIAEATQSRNARQAELDARLTEVRAEYEAVLIALEKQISEKTGHLQVWAALNASEFPEGRKSLQLTHGVIGYRTSPPKLTLLKGQKWDGVLSLLIGLFGGKYIRTKEEVAKDDILKAAQSGDLQDAQLRQLRVAVTQEEAFYVETK
ncbi:MAG: hypothetical protein EBR82_23410 [Caulobacteraceae bacterium]|nr:hypothetical protein [Caulobacteraceae bacterium]